MVGSIAFFHYSGKTSPMARCVTPHDLQAQPCATPPTRSTPRKHRSLSMLVAAIRSSDSGLQSPRWRPSRDRRRRQTTTTSDDINDDNNKDERDDDFSHAGAWFDISFKIDEDQLSDSGMSFDDLGDVPHRSSATFLNHDNCGVQAAPNHKLEVLEDDGWGNRRLVDYGTDGTVVDGKHLDQRDPNTVHAVPSTPPTKPRRLHPPSVEAPDAASPPARYLSAREFRARKAECTSPPRTPRDGGAAWARAVLSKRVDESSARSSVQRRIFMLRAKRGVGYAAPPMHGPGVFLNRIVREDDADALTTRSWSSLWHDVLCGCGDGGGGADGSIADFDVDCGTCFECGLLGPTTISGAAPVEKEIPLPDTGMGIAAGMGDG